MAVWAAASHQARNIYLITCYAVLGFILGMLGYNQYLMRYRQGCNDKISVVSLYVRMGMCMITVCFLLLVQQHLYPASPMWSSLVSLFALGVVISELACTYCVCIFVQYVVLCSAPSTRQASVCQTLCRLA